MSLVTQGIREKAEILHGDAICQEKIKHVLTEMGLPNGLLPVKDVEECGFVDETGFVWIIQKAPSKFCNEKIGGKVTSYAKEVTGFLEKFKVKKITGVKSKELLLWIPLSEVTLDDPLTGKISFKVTSGIGKSYHVSAFQVDDDVKKDVEGVSTLAKDPQVKEV